MGRLGTAEEVADVIVFVVSPCAHWINGRNIAVDGLEQPHAGRSSMRTFEVLRSQHVPDNWMAAGVTA
jgi:hypothetical protein